MTACERRVSGIVKELAIKMPGCTHRGYMCTKCNECKEAKATIRPISSPLMFCRDWDVGEWDKNKLRAPRNFACGLNSRILTGMMKMSRSIHPLWRKIKQPSRWKERQRHLTERAPAEHRQAA